MKKNMFLWSLLLISAIGCSNVTLPDDSTNESTDGSTDTPHDYVVKKVAKGLSGVSIAIGKVDVK
jgi:hypothetical protein